MLNSLAIATAARQHLNTPWRHQGRNPEHGLDCVGLCLVALGRSGQVVPDITNYPRRLDGSVLTQLLTRNLLPVNLADWQQGDVGLFRESGYPVHVGILSLKQGVPSVIHAHARRRKVVEEAWGSYATPFSVFRMKEIQ